MTKYSILFFFLVVVNSFSQEFLTPSIKKSFGLNNHTSRDIIYYTEVDNNDNIISIATTERDSTYTDILITKLDQSLNVLWQKRHSFDYDWSYDIPIKTMIDSNDNTYIVCNSYKVNNQRELYILKYDTNGNLIWNLNLDDFNNSIGDSILYQNVFLDTNDILHVVHAKNDPTFTVATFYFYKIDSNGVLIENYSRDDVVDISNNDFIGLSYEFFHKNDNFYVIYKRNNLTGPNFFYEHFIKKINSTGIETYPLNSIINTNDTSLFNDGIIEVDSNNNMYLVYALSNVNRFKILKLNALGNLSYYIESPNGYEKDVFNVAINSNNNLSLICNSKISNSPDDKTLNVIEYDSSGNLISDVVSDSTFINGLKYYSENSFLVFSEGNFKLFDQELNLISTFNGTYNDFNDFNLINNSNLVLGRTTFAKMYPESDFLSQRDIEIQKIDNSQIVNTYNFSGEGTSKAFRQKIIIDKLDNYIVASEEKLGPDNWSIGGSRAPLQKTIYKYDTNLNLMWSLDIDSFIVNPHSTSDRNFLVDNNNNIYVNAMIDADNFELMKISPNGVILYQVPSFRTANLYFDHQNNVNVVSPPVMNDTTYDDDTYIYTIDSSNGNLLSTTHFEGLVYLNNFKDNLNDSFTYMYTGNNSPGDTNPKIKVYKNLNLDFETNLSINGTFGGIVTVDINDNGDIYFSSAWAQINNKIHKLTLNNNYSYISINEGLSRLLLINDKVFTLNGDGYFNIYDDNLNLISSPTLTYHNQPNLFKLGNRVLYNTHFDSIVKVFDDNATEIDEFKLPSSLSFIYAAADSNDDLILTGQNGKQLSTFHHFSWARGFVHKYDAKDFTLSIPDLNYDTSEQKLKIYPNPTADMLYLDLSESTIESVEVFDLNGRKIIKTSDNSFNVSNLSNGIYLIKAYLIDGSTMNNKFIKN